ncbi:ATPase, F1/V1/A1 complex, alpha/beta subunit, Zinc knuckle CX2CX4HX4C [Artemisia annua]|uniref:ATPase, F1/V1/A1 complex, alpha/beta subunit, Zinc knuckle CX2CX4HX4C n=1 Tax=Artemisia annua TaxID=35608 RepID=A0A2U1P588_ARTAN|nr:ATPase, F1/V1/A1 complex, alpha/beta subunit, Zinc knuckle CX2CX4HX4C [Artemisia annua]
MSELNPHPPNPDPINPTPDFINPNSDLINPNSIPPPSVSNNVVCSKRSTRNSGNDNKRALKNIGVGSKVSLGVKKNSKKGSGRNKSMAKEMEDIEYEGADTEDMEVKDDEGVISDGDNEVTVNDGTQGLTGSGGDPILGAFPQGKSHTESVSLNVNASDGYSSMSNGNEQVIGSSGVDKNSGSVGKPSVVNELKNNGVNSSWPSLNKTKNMSTKNSIGISENVEKVDTKSYVGLEKKDSDTVMAEQLTHKTLSFASAFKGLIGYGNNKLAKVPVRVNAQDRITTSMCERAYGRASFARVLVEVDVASDLVENIKVCYEKLGRSMNLKVEYAWKPPLCTHCRVFGHEFKTCGSRAITVDEVNDKCKNIDINADKIGDKVKTGEEWQKARRFNRNGASTSRTNGQQSNGFFVNRGGFSGRGRGVMQCRGSMAQRGSNESNNVKYVPVENISKKVDDGLVMDGKTKDNTQNKGKGVLGPKENNNGKTKAKNIVNMKNSFDVLAKDGIDCVDVGSDEWVQMRKKIDLACDLGMQIADSEKRRWSNDLRKYYEDKCNAKAKNKLMDGLKWRISKLSKDISYGHNYSAVNAKKNADELCKEIMKESGCGKGLSLWLNLMMWAMNGLVLYLLWPIKQLLTLYGVSFKDVLLFQDGFQSHIDCDPGYQLVKCRLKTVMIEGSSSGWSLVLNVIGWGRFWSVLYSFYPSLWFYPMGFT